ncbi:hypothetical protein ACOMHN_008953 [Nucella lapillus]
MGSEKRLAEYKRTSVEGLSSELECVTNHTLSQCHDDDDDDDDDDNDNDNDDDYRACPGLPSELECVTNHTLSNVIRQLSSVSKMAEDVFFELTEATNKIFQRSRQLQDRIETVQEKVTQLNATVEEVNLQDIHLRKPYRSSVKKEQQVISRTTVPPAILHTYKACEAPPDLDKFNIFREDGKESIKYYTDPTYFVELWVKDMDKQIQENKSELHRKRERRTRRRPRLQHCDLKKPKDIKSSKELWKAMEKGEEFMDHQKVKSLERVQHQQQQGGDNNRAADAHTTSPPSSSPRPAIPPAYPERRPPGVGVGGGRGPPPDNAAPTPPSPPPHPRGEREPAPVANGPYPHYPPSLHNSIQHHPAADPTITANTTTAPGRFPQHNCVGGYGGLGMEGNVPQPPPLSPAFPPSQGLSVPPPAPPILPPVIAGRDPTPGNRDSLPPPPPSPPMPGEEEVEEGGGEQPPQQQYPPAPPFLPPVEDGYSPPPAPPAP